MAHVPTEGETNGFVGLVLVSHSSSIAEGLAELAAQVAGPSVPIVAIGGAADGSLGTDGGKVLDALRNAAAAGGAVVLMDLGSSVLSVRAAQAELSAEELERLVIADAPLVEGTIAAAVTASTGASSQEVAAAAQEARSVSKL
jgi:PTS hybrid protein